MSEDIKIDKYGNVMVYENGKWVRNNVVTNQIKIGLKRGTIKDKIGSTHGGVKITQNLVNEVNKKFQISEKGRGVTSSLKQETGPKGKPLYKDKPVRTEPKAPPKDAKAKAAEATATQKAAKEAQRLKTPKYEITSVKKDGKTTVTVNVNGKPDADLKRALWKVVQNPKNLKGKESIRVGSKVIPIGIVRDFWKAMPKEVTKSIMTGPKVAPRGGGRIGGLPIGGGGLPFKHIK